MRFLKSCFLGSFSLLVILLSGSVYGRSLPDHVSISPCPEWVALNKDLSLQSALSKNAKLVEWLLNDVQIHVPDETLFFHVIYRIVDTEGVQNYSSISPSFDPHSENLSLHSLKIIRDDQVIDKLDAAEIRVAQEENESHRHIYNSCLSAHIILDDTREGDIIEYSYSIKGFPYAFKPHFAFDFSWRRNNPIKREILRILSNVNQKLDFKCIELNILPQKSIISNGTLQELIWSDEDVPSYSREKDAPSWATKNPRIEISDYPNWESVVQHVLPLFAPGELSSLPSEMVSLAKKWKEESAAKENQALCALRFVQDKIRYLGFEDGMYAYTPHDPAWVFKNRFGDCKDKAQLLRAFLNLLEIESWLVLVNGSSGQSLSDCLPSPYLFNHVILKIVIGENVFWVDPTICLQGGDLAHVVHPHYDYGLTIKDDEKGLSVIPRSEQTKTEIFGNIVFGESKDAVLDVNFKFYDWEADYWRSSFNSFTTEELSQFWTKALHDAYGQGEMLKPFDLQDDRERNVLSCDISYRMENFFEILEDGTQISYEIMPFNIRNRLTQYSEKDRQLPLAHEFPYHCEEKYTLIHNKGNLECENFDFQVANKTFKFFVSSKDEEHKITYMYRYQSLKDHVTPEEIPEFQRDLEKARNSSHSIETISDPKEDSFLAKIYLPIVVTLCLGVFWYFRRKKI